jgi:hypothetical protein
MSPLIGFRHGLEEHPQDLPDFRYAWLESPLEACLAWKGQGWRNHERWPAGRLFDERGEYRWQRRGNLLHAVLLLEGEALPEPFEGAVRLQLVEDADLLLWGDWVDPARSLEENPEGQPLYYAQEIPEAQLYPLDGEPAKGEKPRLRTRRYVDVDGEQGEFLRCVSVLLMPDEESRNE